MVNLKLHNLLASNFAELTTQFYFNLTRFYAGNSYTLNLKAIPNSYSQLVDLILFVHLNFFNLNLEILVCNTKFSTRA
ncbi:MAG: hypothetical protein AB4080_24150 [Trichodesmium sp.]